MKRFCIAGPIKPELHYFIPRRLNREQLDMLLSTMQYFVFHAPRQSGKTTAIEEYMAYLNGHGAYNALYINIEPAQAARDDVEKALMSIAATICNKIVSAGLDQNNIVSTLRSMYKTSPLTLNLLEEVLRVWAESSEKPIVLFIDEIDSLIGDSLLSVLRQIRVGFTDRPKNFPQSICLIGLRDVRDYRIWSKKEGQCVSTSSPFNIKAVSLTLTNFTKSEVENLYEQHTQDTGQQFTEEAIEYAHYLTQGQPWLVNALAAQACYEEVPDRSVPITKEVIEEAKRVLIARRDTHIGSLINRLNEKRIRIIIDAVICGNIVKPPYTEDDIQYCIDLGLISISADNLEIANPIYQEIIPAVLAYKFQVSIALDKKWFVNDDGSLNMDRLLTSFTQFFRENSQAWLEDFKYKESGPHILMLAFLQRIINGGGTIHREYALGKRRVDLLITYNGFKYIIELKIKYGEDTLALGLKQTTDYMDLCGADEGHLVIFDRDSDSSWDEKISSETVAYNNTDVHVWTM